MNRGHTHKAAGNKSAALVDFRRALELNPRLTALRKEIAQVEESVGTSTK